MDVLTGRLIAALLSLAMTGCVSARHEAARRYLDEQTAATVTVGARWLFARERPDVAVNVRDYLAVRPVDVNRAGEHRTYLVAHTWSTASSGDPVFPGPPLLVITADDRIFKLVALSAEPRMLGIGEPIAVARGAAARVWYYAIERDAIQYVAASRGVHSALHLGSSRARYEPWQDPRPAAAAFLRAIAL